MTLTPDDWEAVKYLFADALDEKPSSRATFLRNRCGDAVVLAEVERLLAEHEEAGEFLSLPLLESLKLDRTGELTGAQTARRLAVDEVLSGRFRICGFLAAGGMGDVYQAEDSRLERTVALKFLSQELAQDKYSIVHFLSEAMAASALNHPNICTVYDFGEDNGRAFIAMEFLEGETLADRLKRGACSTNEALKIALELSSALCAAHQKGIVHGDLKPGNLMLTDRGTKLLDFGLAKKGAPPGTAEPMRVQDADTVPILGTLAYMSPERLQGHGIDVHGDIFAFGAIFYEMLTGQKAFKKKSRSETITSISREETAPLRSFVHGAPEELERIVSGCLRKNPADRYASMAEVQVELGNLQRSLGGSDGEVSFRWLVQRCKRPRVAIPAMLILAMAIGSIVWWVHYNSRIVWAKSQALPQIANLIREEKPGDAYNVAVEAERYIPHDPALMRFWWEISRTGTIHSTPAGVAVYRKNYNDRGGAWEFVGRTPIDNHRFPFGDSLWNFELQGFDTVQRASFPAALQSPTIEMNVTMDRTGQAPEGMVRVDLAATEVGLVGISGFEQTPPTPLSNYWIDKFEVTNKDFKRFVDSGGYSNPRYWKQEFDRYGQTLLWAEAMKLFRDSTGKPGPATWSNGQYPAGQDDYPVAGVSWFEAAAYAESVGKQLPTIYHWKSATPMGAGPSIIPLSNFDGKGPARVGTYQGIGRSGVYDMAGNVKEWVLNEATPGKRYILGGAWNEPAYLFFQADARSPFERSANFGFRCARYSLNGDERKAANPVFAKIEDYNSGEPVSDQVFKAYKSLYSYDKTPLNAVTEPFGETPDWKEEKITFDAAYGNERVIAFLFLPKNASPPYQTVIYFHGADAFYERSSEMLNRGYLKDLDFIVKGGRAVMFVEFKGMFDRWDNLFSMPRGSSFYRDHVFAWSKDLGRSLDYLETRPDIDGNKFAYEGVSMGAAMGALLPSVEPRLKVLLLMSPGFYLQKRLPEADQRNFAPHIKIPVLMLNGKFDFIFPVDLSQEPLFREVGTPANQKLRIVYDCGHDLPRAEESKESLMWLDQYLGQVKR